jgi:hypothetical protein
LTWGSAGAESSAVVLITDCLEARRRGGARPGSGVPVEFLTDEQAARYAAYDGAPSRTELERFFSWTTRTGR